MMKYDLAILPMSCKPPHKGHLYLIEQAQKLANEVAVFISSPKKSLRLANNGREITSEQSVEILKLFKPEVDYYEFNSFQDMFDIININYPEINSVVMVSSSKDGEGNKYKNLDLSKYLDVSVIKQETVQPLGNISASDIRKDLYLDNNKLNIEYYKNFLPSISKQQEVEIIQILENID